MFASHRAVATGEFTETIGIEFDEFAIGQVFEHRPPFTFSFAEARFRALRAGDHAPVAVDPAVAAAVGGGRALIPEYWVLTAFAAVTTRTFGRVVANLAWHDVRFEAPIRDGDVIHAESEILGKRESRSRPDQGILHVAARGRFADGALACRFERRLLVYRGASGPHMAAGYV